MLLQQFHDILPGSSIAWVHRDAERNYAHVAGELEEIIGESLRAIAAPGTRTLIANAAPHGRSGAPALGIAEARIEARVAPAREGEDWVFDNGVIRVRVDSRGLVVSAADAVTGREAVAPGRAAGMLQLHRDTPTQWDAWDIDEHYRNTVLDLEERDSIEVEGDELVIRRGFGRSTVVERLALRVGSRTLEFTFDIDWHEKQKLLKLAFPIDVHTDRAASEIQFGHLARPIHTNTSWDAARFETVAHRWVRVAEPGFGVAIVNDSTYGHDFRREPRDERGGTITTARLSLIRAALFPDPHQDQGAHRVHVGFVVGAGVEDAIREGYRINLPMRTIQGATEIDPLVSVDDGPGIVVEAVKLAEDGSGDVIVRLYEAFGARAVATVGFGFPVGSVVQTDLLEREIRPEGAEWDGERVLLSLRPFQIVTLRASVA